MAYEFKLPDIGEGVVEGEIVRWLVKEGESLREDQPMVEIMTDKATVEIPSPRAGTVARRMYAEGDKCPVGKVLIVIEEGGAAAAAESGAKAPAAEMAASAAGASAAGTTAASAGGKSASSAPGGAAGASTERDGNGSSRAGILATPATRKLARDRGVDLAHVIATGPAGRITAADVEQHARGNGARAATSPAMSLPAFVSVPAGVPPGADVRIPLRGLRKKIAENMARSKRTAAHFTYVEEVDCTDLVSLREKANQRLGGQGIKLSYLPFIVKAVVGALKRYPQMNATFDEAAGEIVQRRSYHIGIAAATKDGLIVPVVRDADRRSIVGLAQEIERLALATKTGKASREELTGSTFTITSLGALAGVLATPIINVPEVAIMGVHKITKRPVVKDEGIVARDVMNLSISVDHRAVDGYDAALFMAEVKQSLETPGLLFLEAI